MFRSDYSYVYSNTINRMIKHPVYVCVSLSLTYSLSLFLSRCLSIRLSIFITIVFVSQSFYLPFSFWRSVYISLSSYSHILTFFQPVSYFYLCLPYSHFLLFLSHLLFSQFLLFYPRSVSDFVFTFWNGFRCTVTSTLHIFVSDFFCHA